jgi:hypothetical protein
LFMTTTNRSTSSDISRKGSCVASSAHWRQVAASCF